MSKAVLMTFASSVKRVATVSDTATGSKSAKPSDSARKPSGSGSAGKPITLSKSKVKRDEASESLLK